MASRDYPDQTAPPTAEPRPVHWRVWVWHPAPAGSALSGGRWEPYGPPHAAYIDARFECLITLVGFHTEILPVGSRPSRRR